MMHLQLIINFRASLKPFKATDFFAFLFLPLSQRDVCNNPVAVQLNILSMKKYVEKVLIIFMPVFVREKDIHGMMAWKLSNGKMYSTFLEHSTEVKEMADTVHLRTFPAFTTAIPAHYLLIMRHDKTIPLKFGALHYSSINLSLLLKLT